VKGAPKERVGEKKQQKNKPWFDEECIKLHEEKNKQVNDGKVIKAKHIPITTVTQNATPHVGSETKSENI